MKRITIAIVAVALGLCAAAARAEFHLFRIDQVYSNADGKVQYVVIRESTGSNGENFLQNRALTMTSAAGTKLFLFPTNLPSSATASRSVLIATSGFAALGLVTPDYTIPDGFVAVGGGTLDYASFDHITFGALPTDGATAIDRNGNHVAATPKNFAGASATITAGPPGGGLDLDQQGLTGSWYEPATSGQGMEIEFFPNLAGPSTALVAGAWFTFDTGSGGADRQRWYTFTGNAQSGQSSVPITILRNVGGTFNAPPVTNASPVGTGTLSFSGCTAGTLDYQFTDGRSGSIPLSRLLPSVTCAAGSAPTTNADFAFSGNWYDASTSGQGFVFEVNPTQPFFFLTWYTYAPGAPSADPAGQRWFTGQGSFTPGMRTITAKLYETTGGVFDQPTNPAQATVEVGSATVTFMSCTSAQLQFSFTSASIGSRSGTINLTRIGPVPAGCLLADASLQGDMPMMPGGGYGGGGYGP